MKMIQQKQLEEEENSRRKQAPAEQETLNTSLELRSGMGLVKEEAEESPQGQEVIINTPNPKKMK